MPLKKGNVIQAKTGTLARGDSGKVLFTLPAQAMVIGVKVFGGLSSGGTTGTLSIGCDASFGQTAAATDILNALSLHAAYAAEPTLNAGNLPYKQLSMPAQITGTIGGDDSAGGPWSVVVEYL